MTADGPSPGVGQPEGPPPRPPAPPPLAADVGVVAAMPVEVGFLLDRLTRVRKYAGPRNTVIEGEHSGKVIAVIVGGMGRAAARRAGEHLIDGHRPRWLISAGFAGALDPALKRNDALWPDTIVDPEGHSLTVDFTLPEASEGRGPKLATGRLLTVDAVACTAAEKAALRERSGADLVDMESSALAGLCAERGLRFLAVRVVSDEAGAELPRDVIALGSRKGSYLVGSALRTLWNRPSSLKDMLSLHNHAQEAADRLAEVILDAITRLPG